MQTAIANQPPDLESANAELRCELTRLRAENARLRRENRDLRAALDAHVARASSTALYGALELTAGTCVGPVAAATGRRSRVDN